MDRFPFNMKKQKKTKARFSDEQIRSLESIFVFDSKLDPSKKLALARELGLKPQQIAIWFQNRRARWKSKQLEQDTGILKAKYDDLAARFEDLKKENQSLLIQLQKLGDQMRESRESGSTELGLAGNSKDGKVENREYSEFESEKDLTALMSSKSESNNNMEDYKDKEEPDSMNVVEPAHEVFQSPDNWRGTDSVGLLDQSLCGNSEWWEFWS